ncbi:hypothetical protein HHK36_021302 [Tetracentron sinense]|uniref:Pre-mRNA polyadenylation factor Fip1 domain-containing protein n=1 Tax=Tetracentron sinense TaxID=13715 RepID=A0A835D7P4_TETSI|nr:hypothetical protein HHK36_021302 [Tetracentron sinense]
MEDDDDFGDLYTDVLRPFSSPTASQPHLASSANPPRDLNLHSDDEEILYGAPDPNFALPPKNINQNLVSDYQKVEKDQIPGGTGDAALNLNDDHLVEEEEEKGKLKDEEEEARVSNDQISDSQKVDLSRVLKTEDVELEAEVARVLETPEPCEKPGIGEVKVEERDKDDFLMEKVDIVLGDEMGKKLEIDVGIGDMDSEPIIPGLSSGPYIPGVFDSVENVGEAKVSRRDDTGAGGGGGGGGDDWDSDSEDDLQIVLNDSSGPIGMDRNEGVGSDDEDEDEEDLIIVADDGQHHQPIEEQEWGEDSAQAADGERKEMGEAAKANGGMINAAGTRIGHINHVYHPHHSQFKNLLCYSRADAFNWLEISACTQKALQNCSRILRRPSASLDDASPTSFVEWDIYGIPMNRIRPYSMYVRPGAAPMPGGAILDPGGAPGQIRPLVNMGLIVGRGRGDWRPIGTKNGPIMQKSFHSGFGMPIWGNNTTGRGSGLEFTLPSHKTVFDIDIDSFEEKPWRHPGIDATDFFNFGLGEDNWKDYCKQLAQLRLEATMQSKIRVYESGRTEQDYDPDLPPELAAAAGIHDVSAENAHIGKIDAGQGDFMGQGRGAARIRPPIPTGRAIQVEGGYGERLPSIDTRPPRIRDSDAIIEIVLQDSVDDSIPANGVLERSDNDPQGEDLKERGHEVEEDIAQTDTEYFGQFPQTHNGSKREMMGRGAPFMGSVHNNIHEGDGILPFPPELPLRHHRGSKGQTPVYRNGGFGTTHGGRWPQETARDRYPHVTAEHGNDVTPSQIEQGKRLHDNQKEKSGESIDDKQSPELSSPVSVEAAREPSDEHRDDVHDELALADSGNKVEGEEMTLDTIIPNNTIEDETRLHSVKKQKLSSQVEQPSVQDIGDGDDFRVTRSSDNSKARSGSSRDYIKRRDGGEEEVVQDGRSRRMGDMKKHHGVDEHSFRGRDDYGRDGRQEMDRNRMVVRGREDSSISYPHRDWDPNSAHYAHTKTDRPKDRSNSVGAWQRRDEDPHGKRVTDEDTRKRERLEDMGSRHRSKVRDSERNDKDEHHSRKQLDNGDWRGRQDKDVGPRHRERDDNFMRHEKLDDPHAKRRKDEEQQRREQADKEKASHAYGAREDTSRRKRERDDQPRVRDKSDDHHSVRHRDESWRQRERDERQRLKQPHEDTLSKRDREGRGAVRSGQGVEDKHWVGNARAKDESKGSDKDPQFKDRRGHSEQPRRREQVVDGTLSHKEREDVYARENQFSNEERSSRQERSSTHNDRAVNASDSQWMHKERYKENTGKRKEPEGGDQNTLGHSKRKQEDHRGHRNEKVNIKGTSKRESGKSGNILTSGPTDSHDPGQLRSSSSTAFSKKSHHEHETPQQRHSSKKHREDAPSDDERQDSRRGRSKLERWASQKERDDKINVQSSSSSLSKAKETDKNNDPSLANELPDESTKTVEAFDSQHPSVEETNASDLEIKDADLAPMSDNQHVDSDKNGEDRHLDTVEKLKKRSERFKLPMPSEKDAMANRKMECEALLPAQSETTADAEIKQERPARKRRWISN